MTSPRIAIFDDWIPFHIGSETHIPNINSPINWQDFINNPKFIETYNNGEIREYRLEDQRAIDEIYRILHFETCPICSRIMSRRPQEFYEHILVCLNCGFWGGRGNRMHHVDNSILLRGAIGIYQFLKPLQSLETEYLVTHLRRFPNQLPNIGPKRAEKFVVDLLADYLDCEVKPIGGTKDKGVDGFIIKNDTISSIIQIKWRENMHGAESVKVVREVAGTLLARGVPEGILVSNRDHFSKDALDDARAISKIKINNLGKMKMTLLDYHNILDMLEISNKKLTENMALSEWFDIDNAYRIFDGAMRLPEEFVNMFKQ